MCVAVVGGSRRSTVRVNVSFFLHANSSLWGRHSCRVCVTSSTFPPSVWHRPPTQSRIPRKFLCHVVSQGGQALLLQNSHPGTGLSLALSLTHTHTHTHISIHQECRCNTNRTKHRRIPLFVVMTLFTWWRLGYENEKCGWITFAVFLKHLWYKTLWILFLYDSKFLLMSHRKHTVQQKSTAPWQTRLLHINMHQQTQFTRQLYYPSFKWAARHFCSTNTFFTKMKRRSRLCLFNSEALLVRISLEVELKWTQANCLWSLTFPLPSAGVFIPTLATKQLSFF